MVLPLFPGALLPLRDKTRDAWNVILQQGDMIMKEKRNSARYPASARIQIGDNQNSALFLKDISITGCSITNSIDGRNPVMPDGFEADTLEPAADGAYPEADREYKILVFPETESGIASFELVVELCWSRIQGNLYESGGLISGYPEGKQYQLFADYLAWRVANT
jgi:hypothetical protein